MAPMAHRRRSGGPRGRRRCSRCRLSSRRTARPRRPRRTPLGLLGLWSFDPTVQVPLVRAGVAWVSAVRTVNRAHPAHPGAAFVARVAFLLAACSAIELALQSPIERYDTTLFSVHMVQHILLTHDRGAADRGGAPITLLLRFARPDVRRRWILPVLHSRVLRVLTYPVVAWLLFAAVMWGTHFSPLFNTSLEEPFVHQLEHLLYLGAALLFWWPIVGVDPESVAHAASGAGDVRVPRDAPEHVPRPGDLFGSSTSLYAHYATLSRTWGPTVLADQQLAGGLMWIVGDLTFLVAILFVVARLDAPGGPGHGPPRRAPGRRAGRDRATRGAPGRPARPRARGESADDWSSGWRSDSAVVSLRGSPGSVPDRRCRR